MALALAAVVWGPAAAEAQTQQELDAAASSDDDWLLTNKDYAGRRFTNLRQIDRRNVAKLKPVCTWQSNVEAPSQTSPIVYKGIMYVTVGYLTAAVDGASCKELWRHVWTPTAKELSNPNRGAALKDGKLLRGTPDGNLIALDTATGKVLWSKQIASPKDNHYLSQQPVVVDDLVIIGTAGADFGSRGWLGAFKLENGDEVWKFYVVPQAGEPGAETWSDPKVLPHGGGSFWTPLSLDREKGVLYAPAGNPAPDFYGEVREGPNLYTNAAVALDVKTGKVLWRQQFVPHDVHDWDLTQVSPLLTVEAKGKKRDIVIVSGKDALLRGVDRDTHEQLYEVAISTRKNTATPLTVKGVHVCPGLLGGQEWSTAGYSPALGLIFTPSVEWCGRAAKLEKPPAYQVGEHYRGGSFTQDPPAKAKGWLTAIDPASGKVRWKYNSKSPMLANVTATAGDLVLTGTMRGEFVALDARSGKLLYRHPVGGAATGGVVTYAVKGKQYVAVEAGRVSVFFGGAGPATFTVFALP
ncbi:pyrroloquinoline quinone-dependent dehydrogenase [Anaeromyxobacter diazotrophicus]|uniref:Alcohol dehydrogenase n=1 Tax=Anaeromyxobacter diazotrophicus TaxID=2590199 RepID=A0A7I9VMT2_9BACT|nr:PQQ-binding-like beta-propeller repeat protein [Anaeromyxobacter diazotrophicus]GEJ57713.1 alcohol dehydrogenase [Anaeromyxobacter diazotrophicus]